MVDYVSVLSNYNTYADVDLAMVHGCDFLKAGSIEKLSWRKGTQTTPEELESQWKTGTMTISLTVEASFGTNNLTISRAKVIQH